MLGAVGDLDHNININTNDNRSQHVYSGGITEYKKKSKQKTKKQLKYFIIISSSINCDPIIACFRKLTTMLDFLEG